MKPHGNTQHGMTETPEYLAWRNMQTRCFNDKCEMFEHYGGRGITVAPEWLGDGGFSRFVGHVGLRPTDEHSIDRIDNDRDYEPGNVRWATATEQARNSRVAKLTTEDVDDIRRRYASGETQTAIARSVGVSQARISKIVRHEAWL